ncbi:hypothetical protein Tco_1151739 [Tanacetum coccineum]
MVLGDAGVVSGSPVRVMVEPLDWNDICGMEKSARMGPNDPSHDIPRTMLAPSIGRTKKGMVNDVFRSALGDAKPRKATGESDRSGGLVVVEADGVEDRIGVGVNDKGEGVRAIEGGKGELGRAYVEAVVSWVVILDKASVKDAKASSMGGGHVWEA